MRKSLKHMTLEELWELFPIILAPHNPDWQDWADEEIQLLSLILKNFNPVINHIGSTAIPRIHAKPTVDILVEVSNDIEWSLLKEVLKSNGYICMSESENRISFNKGYTPTGYADRVFHIHIHRTGDNDEIVFRDYLTSHPDQAKAYETLKLSLLPRFRNDRHGYTQAKSEFVRIIVDIAKGE